ncbi:glucose-1-phosphate cytidylyltransferase [Fundidesulfovibrio butyratiphilus]
MQTVILCGGLGTRLAEETQLKPKPMVEVGGRPILWHIMNIYAAHGLTDFVLALGYKAEVIKDYFLHYHGLTSDLKIHLGSGQVEYANTLAEDWTVHMVDTGPVSMTGGRLKRLESILRPGGTFCFTYGDGVSDVDVAGALAFHRAHGKLATVTAVRPPARFGAMVFDGQRVVSFKEKVQTGEGWINGGYFLFEPGVFDYLENDATILEEAPLERLAADGQLMAYRHEGFWQCMDTVRDRNHLESLWKTGKAPWKVWRD